MIIKKIVNDIQRFTKAEYIPISLSPPQFSNLGEISRQYFYDQILHKKRLSLKASLLNDLTTWQVPTTGVTFGCSQSIPHMAEV